MKRATERFDRRRAALLDSAWDLIVEQGYEGTTVAALIDHAGVSKGTFYHYFASKDEVVDAVVGRVIRTVLAEIERAVAGGGGAIEKLDRFLGVSSRRPAAVRPLRLLALQVRRSGNTALLDALREKMLVLCSPPLERIIEQGIEEGAFDTPYPSEVAELMLLESDLALVEVSRILLGPLEPERMERALLRRAEFSVHVYERMLGAPRGTLQRPDPGDIRAVIEVSRREEGLRDG